MADDMLLVTVGGRPVGKAYPDEIFDGLASMFPDKFTSRRRKRLRCKARRRERLAAKRASEGGTP